MFSKLLFLAFILVMANLVSAQAPTLEAGVPQTLARWRAANYSDVRYQLNLTLEKGAPVLQGTMTVSLKNKGDQIVLDWRKIRGKEDLSKITNVFINGKPAFRAVSEPPANATSSGNAFRFEEINEHLVFRDGVVAGENVIKLDFTSPIASSGAAVTRYVDKEDGAEYVYSLFVPSDASTAFPVFDQPDLKARFQLKLFMPEDWRAVSNTLGEEFIESYNGRNGRTTYFTANFEETKPISSYVFAFAAGNFERFIEGQVDSFDAQLAKVRKNFNVNEHTKIYNALYDPAKTKIYVRKSQAEKFKAHAAETFRLNREAVKYLETYFDYKFPFPKYDLVLIPEFPFGGMEHAGATFLRESSVIFPSEPTANDFISRGNLIFHEAAHQWFGDTVTMRWFDDLWLKEGFAEFMAYKTLEKVLPEYNAWKAFYERNKPLAYLTDATRGTTPIYQEIPNLSAAKSAYGNIVYRKAPSFLRQAEFYLGEDKFQRAVRAFLKKHEFSNAEWTDLVKEFETASEQDLKDWANVWVKRRGMPIIRISRNNPQAARLYYVIEQKDILNQNEKPAEIWKLSYNILEVYDDGEKEVKLYLPPVLDSDKAIFTVDNFRKNPVSGKTERVNKGLRFIFPNYQDYGYGIFLLDAQSRDYVLKNIQNEKDAFLRSMMWGTLWDSVREAELAPREYVELAIKNISVETDELTIQTILSRVATAMNYYLSDRQRAELAPQIEDVLIEQLTSARTRGQRTTFYRAFLNIVSTEKGAFALENVLNANNRATKEELEAYKKPANNDNKKPEFAGLPVLSTKDKFDLVTKLLILGYKDAPQFLAELEKTEKSDDAKRYAYAAKAGIANAENKARFWNDFVNNKEISESWIESAFAPFNAPRHSELTLPYLEKALAELPNLKRSRKIFFVNGWLAAFIGGQKDEKALAAVNKFLADNPNLDRDLRLKILENVDTLERAVKIRAKYGR